jgi:hypothetical protein
MIAHLTDTWRCLIRYCTERENLYCQAVFLSPSVSFCDVVLRAPECPIILDIRGHNKNELCKEFSHLNPLVTVCTDGFNFQQARQCTCNVTLRCNHCYRRKGISITYSECMSIALVIQHAVRMRRIILSSVACLGVTYFATVKGFHSPTDTQLNCPKNNFNLH